MSNEDILKLDVRDQMMKRFGSIYGVIPDAIEEEVVKRVIEDSDYPDYNNSDIRIAISNVILDAFEQYAERKAVISNKILPGATVETDCGPSVVLNSSEDAVLLLHTIGGDNYRGLVQFIIGGFPETKDGKVTWWHGDYFTCANPGDFPATIMDIQTGLKKATERFAERSADLKRWRES